MYTQTHKKIKTVSYLHFNNCCLINKDAAQSLNLIREPITMNISTASGCKSIPSKRYQVPLIDESNLQHIISAFEVDSISDSISSVELSNVIHMFSPEIQGNGLQFRPDQQVN